MFRMRKVLLVGMVLGLLVLLITVPQTPAQYGAESVPGELVVGLEPGASSSASQAVSATVQGFGGRIVDEIPEISAVKVEVPAGNEQAAMGMVQSLGNVDYVEPNYLAEMLSEPDDEYWDKQWDMRKISAPQAWDLVKGSKDIVVAVVDTGIDYTHPDLKEDYTSGGYDYVHDDNDPYPVGDGVGGDRGVAHGSHVAGTIGATMDNSKGIAGLAQVSIMGFRVLNDEGSGSFWNVAKGIVEGTKAGAKIINLSLGGPRGKIVEAAVNFAYTAGTLVVAAEGNSGRRGVICPACYESVIAVSATDNADHLASFSNYGSDVAIAAPGEKVTSIFPGGYAGTSSGTSFAAPHVAGTLALILSCHPGISSTQAIALLKATSIDLGSRGLDRQFGAGLVDAANAVASSS